MTSEEAVRKRLLKARQTSDRLFGQAMQNSSNPDLSQPEKLLGFDLFREAEAEVQELRTMLWNVLKAEQIREEIEQEESATKDSTE